MEILGSIYKKKGREKRRIACDHRNHRIPYKPVRIMTMWMIIKLLNFDPCTKVNILYSYVWMSKCQLNYCLLCMCAWNFCRHPIKIVVPTWWYKLLVWCENGQVNAEVILTYHKNRNAKQVSYYNDSYYSAFLTCWGKPERILQHSSFEHFLSGITPAEHIITLGLCMAGS